MKQIGRVLAALLIFGPLAANADPVTWEFNGEINNVDGSPGVSIGDEIGILVTFDTDAPLVATQTGGAFAPGARYEYDTSGISIVLSLPGFADQLLTASGYGFLWLRDDSGDRTGVDGFGPSDGLTFVVSDGLSYELDIVLRGTILDIFSGSALPGTPDSRLMDLEIKGFNWFTSDDGFATFDSAFGDFSSIRSVPEPSTLALLGLGQLGMGLSRRSKKV